jgi:hypothetical protein
MAGGPRRPRFYLAVLVTGFLLGGFLSAFLRRFLPDSPTREFFTYAVQPGLGPLAVGLLGGPLPLLSVVFPGGLGYG